MICVSTCPRQPDSRPHAATLRRRKKGRKQNILNVWKQSVQKLKLAPFGKNPQHDDHQILVESAQGKEIDKFEYIIPFSIRYINIPRHRKITKYGKFPN